MRLFVVTGVSSGLGAEIARQLGARGETVIGISRKATSRTAGPRPEGGAALRVLTGDLSHASDATRLAAELAAAVTRDVTRVVFVSNAGVIGPIDSVGRFNDPAGVVHHVTVNYTAPVLLTNALVAALPAGAALDVVNVSSGAAERQISGWSLYCSSKKAAKTFFDLLDAENDRVSVRHVDPGVMDTDMQRQIRGSTEAAFPSVATFRAYHDDGLLRSPRDVARSIVESCLGL